MNDIDILNKLIKESNNIVFFGGAGVSTESGLKDFRSNDGLYSNKIFDRNPEYLLSHTCLVKEPELFFKYCKSCMDFRNALPNITHKFLVKLEECGKLKAVVTQNIDGLHEKAGSKNVFNIHGSMFKNYCIDCKKEYDENILYDCEGIPKCECGGTIRPRVTLYEESLPEYDFNMAIKYISSCDTLIVAGTSLTVNPAASLINLFMGKNLVIINNEKTPYDKYATLVINKPLKDVFSKMEV